jgi:hypothetical protein
MKIALIALVLVASLAQTEAYWGYGYGGLYGGLWGGMYGGLYGGMYGGLYGGYGYGFWGKRDVAPPTEILNRTECIYSKEAEMLSCHGPTGIVECKTEITWTTPVDFQMFSLGLYKEASVPMKYRIMPRKIDNSGWESGMYKLNGEKKWASLYVEDEIESGLEVDDKECFQRLVDLLAMSNRKELCEVESEEVYVIGDLMIAKKMPIEEREAEERDTRSTEEMMEDKSSWDKKSIAAELKEMKVRAEKEWDLVERNTNTLMNAVNKIKRQLADLMEDNQQSTLERRDNHMWEDSNTMSSKF